jgi:RNA polymerase subunit RPABC4/transcription elongation factor Spt4
MNDMQETMKSCNVCRATIPSDSKYCEVCGTKLLETLTTTIATEPDAATAKTQPEFVPSRPRMVDKAPKPRRFSAKMVVAVLVIICLISLLLVVPWIPMVKSRAVREVFAYSYTYPFTEEQPKQQAVFSSGNVSLNAFKSASQADYYWTSRGFLLEKGWTVQVKFQSNNYAWTTLYIKGGWQGDTYFSTNSPLGSFIVSQPNEFHVFIQNLDPTSGHAVSVELTAQWTEVRQSEETATGTATFDVTRYDVAYVSLIDLLLHKSQLD